MNRMGRSLVGAGGLCVLLLFGMTARAQTSPSLLSGYSLAREVNLVGTVSSIIEDSNTGPLGTHVLMQTPIGVVDVHVGSAKFLKSNNLDLAAGDNVRIIGEIFGVASMGSAGTDTVFLARIVQKGVTAVAVRSPRGMPLWRAGTRLQATTKTPSHGGAL